MSLSVLHVVVGAGLVALVAILTDVMKLVLAGLGVDEERAQWPALVRSVAMVIGVGVALGYALVTRQALDGTTAPHYATVGTGLGTAAMVTYHLGKPIRSLHDLLLSLHDWLGTAEEAMFHTIYGLEASAGVGIAAGQGAAPAQAGGAATQSGAPVVSAPIDPNDLSQAVAPPTGTVMTMSTGGTATAGGQ